MGQTRQSKLFDVAQRAENTPLSSSGGLPRQRQTRALDPSEVSQIGSEGWATEVRAELQEALERAVGGRLDFTKEMVHFFDATGWKALKNHAGVPFTTCREFGLAPRPEGLMLTPRQFQAFMADIQRAVQEMANEAEVTKEDKHGTNRFSVKENGRHYNVMSRKQGNRADYLARRIARDRPDILDGMKAGHYSSVYAAAKAAGIIHTPTRLEQLQKLWKTATAEEQQQFRAWLTQTEKE